MNNPLEGYVYKLARQSMVDSCLRLNKANKEFRLEEVARWPQKADWARANGRPEPEQPAPPEMERFVDGPLEGTDQNLLSIKVGTTPVADPTPLVLAEVPNYLLGKYLPNVTAISGITSDGSVLTCFPEDTRATGWKEIYNGLVGIKVETTWPFGRKSFYNVVGPA